MEKGVNIFLIDDDKVINLLHQKMMEKTCADCMVHVFSNPVTAVKDLRKTLSDSPQPSIVLLDINMPEMNAWEFLDQLNEPFVKHRFQVIVVSSSVDQEDKDKAATYSSVVDFVEKPLQKAWLLQNEKRFSAIAD